MTVLVPHDPGCKYARPDGGGHSDMAKRVSDWHNTHRQFGSDAAIGRYIAVALADGCSDGVLYDTKRDAVRHQHHNERFYAYIAIQPASMTICQAESVMRTFRMVYGAKGAFVDPDHPTGGQEIVRRLTREDQASLMHSVRMRGLVRPSNLIYPGDNRR